MKIFISWSGERSKQVAAALREWLPRVIQAAKPWMSGNDISAGARWEGEIAKELENCRFGIVCVTPENVISDWLNFEAGALSKVVSAAHVCPYLLDIQPTDVSGPLSQFQAMRATRVDTLKLLETINRTFDMAPLTSEQLADSFAAFWPRLETMIETAKKAVPGTVTRRPERELLEETLSLVRDSAQNQQAVLSQIRRLTARMKTPLTLGALQEHALAAAARGVIGPRLAMQCFYCGNGFDTPNLVLGRQSEVECPECHGVHIVDFAPSAGGPVVRRKEE